MSRWHLELLWGAVGMALLITGMILLRPSFGAVLLVSGSYFLGRADGIRRTRQGVIGGAVRDTG